MISAGALFTVTVFLAFLVTAALYRVAWLYSVYRAQNLQVGRRLAASPPRRLAGRLAAAPPRLASPRRTAPRLASRAPSLLPAGSCA